MVSILSLVQKHLNIILPERLISISKKTQKEKNPNAIDDFTTFNRQNQLQMLLNKSMKWAQILHVA